MKTTLYVSLTANGKLGQNDGGEHAIPLEIFADVVAHARQAGNMILGRRTYDLMGTQPAFGQALADVEIVVVSGHETTLPGVTAVTSPQAALAALDDHAFAAAVVAGGGTLDGAFLSEGLIDELYVNIIPSVIGAAPVLPVSDGTALKLRMIDTKRLADNLLQIHYAVER